MGNCHGDPNLNYLFLNKGSLITNPSKIFIHDGRERASMGQVRQRNRRPGPPHWHHILQSSRRPTLIADILLNLLHSVDVRCISSSRNSRGSTARRLARHVTQWLSSSQVQVCPSPVESARYHGHRGLSELGRGGCIVGTCVTPSLPTRANLVIPYLKNQRLSVILTRKILIKAIGIPGQHISPSQKTRPHPTPKKSSDASKIAHLASKAMSQFGTSRPYKQSSITTVSNFANIPIGLTRN